MTLRAVKPEAIEKRLKLFMYGPAGVGKTTAAIQFPHAYIIDMERGTENYVNTISKNKSVVFQTTDVDDVKDELKKLLTEKHEHKTLIIDPVTSLYNGVQEKWARVFSRYAAQDGKDKQAELQDFGMRYWGRVKSDYKGIQRMLLALDMNVIVTSHQKDIYGPNMQKVGVGPDAMKGDEYFFDYVFQLENPNRNGARIARTIKERADIGEQKFPESFDWSYQNFSKFYGAKVLEREATPVKMATTAQVTEITKLVEILRVDEADVTKLFTKNDVDAWDELTADVLQKYIDTLKKKLQTLNGKAVAA